MQKIRPFYLGFSFRAGALIFFVLCATLLTLRLLIYTQTVSTADADIRLILSAHVEEINQGIERYGVAYAKDLVETIIEDTHDKNLYLLLRQDSGLTGNLPLWPNVKRNSPRFNEVNVTLRGRAAPLHLLTHIIKYPEGAALLIGYDLQRIDMLRQALFRVLVENMALALVVSLAISLFLVGLLNRHFRRFNTACDHVMAGDVNYRIRAYGTGDEFDRLAININRMLDWNNALIATVKDSGNAIAHDMRTPLSRLRLELRALSDRPGLDDGTRARVLEQVDRVDALVEMFDNILNIAKAESRSSTELFEPVNMTQLVQDVLEFYQAIIEKKQISLQADIPRNPLVIRGDKQLLGQAIVNLLDNACKYTPEGGHIKVRLQRDGDDILFTISDNGIGIPPGLLEKAKDRFFRVDSSRNTEGHGLGLSIVNAVAFLHHGSLVLEDNAPGLRVILTLHGARSSAGAAPDKPLTSGPRNSTSNPL